jgi:hypothetical protein
VLSAKRYLSERGGEILNSAAIVPLASSSCHIVSYKMTYRAILLKILILFLLYSDWIFTLAGRQSPMVPWFGLEMGLGSSCHSGSRLAGEYCVILLSNELFDGHICLLECTLAAKCYSLMPHTSHIFPISDVACGGAHREVIVQVSDIDCAATY